MDDPISREAGWSSFGQLAIAVGIAFLLALVAFVIAGAFYLDDLNRRFG